MANAIDGGSLGARSESTYRRLWSFCSQVSGRPLELIAAMQMNETTEIMEWLTIREFGTRAADAAFEAFHDRQSHEIKVGLKQASERGVLDRWATGWA